jgi:hypothetical protein
MHWHGLRNPFNPIEALRHSAGYLRELRERFGNLGLAAAAYNAGPGRVSAWLINHRLLPGETRNYVTMVTRAPLDKFCEKLTAAGSTCDVMHNEFGPWLARWRRSRTLSKPASLAEAGIRKSLAQAARKAAAMTEPAFVK